MALERREIVANYLVDVSKRDYLAELRAAQARYAVAKDLLRKIWDREPTLAEKQEVTRTRQEIRDVITKMRFVEESAQRALWEWDTLPQVGAASINDNASKEKRVPTNPIGTPENSPEDQAARFGKIEPAFPDGLMLNGLELPLPTGVKKVSDIALSSRYYVPAFTDTAYVSEPTDIKVTLPADAPLSVPFGSKIVAADISREVEQRGPVFSFNSIRPEPITYVVRKETAPVSMALQGVVPNSAEQLELRKLMPLPADVSESIQADPTMAIPLLKRFFQENFSYALDKNLSLFLRDRMKDLPLIASNMQMGHCQLLAWAFASYLRSFGINALITDELAADEKGDKFLKNGHARVGVIQADGKLDIYDPTAYCKTLKEIPVELVKQLERDFASALSEVQKKRALARFQHGVKEVNRKEEQNPTAGNDSVLRNSDLMAVHSFQAAWYTNANIDMGNRAYRTSDAAEYAVGDTFHVKTLPIELNGAFNREIYTQDEENLHIQASIEASLKTAKLFPDVKPTFRFSADFCALMRQLVKGRKINIFDSKAVADEIQTYFNRKRFTKDVRGNSFADFAEMSHMSKEEIAASVDAFYKTKSPNEPPSHVQTDIAVTVAQFPIFLQLQARAITDKGISEKLEHDFFFKENDRTELAKKMVPVSTSQSRDVSEKPSVPPAFYPSWEQDANRYKANDDHLKKANRAAHQLLAGYSANRQESDESWKIVPYDGTQHVVRQISHTISARVGETVVRVREGKEVQEEKLYIYFDLLPDASDWTSECYSISNFLKNAVFLSRKTKKKVYIASQFSDQYVPLPLGANKTTIDRLANQLAPGKDRPGKKLLVYRPRNDEQAKIIVLSYSDLRAKVIGLQVKGQKNTKVVSMPASGLALQPTLIL